ncbi:MAG: TA system VapC family ribonuclease toxin [Pyrinomonadaceae bacterium]
MILPDVNLLIYAYNSGDPHHAAAKPWLEGLFNGDDQFGLSWLSISGFLRIITTETLYDNGFSTAESLRLVDEWLERPNMVFLAPTTKHYQIFKKQVLSTGISGASLTDAHFAALAIEHNVTLATNDRRFRRFDGLKVIFPLLAK